MGCLVSPRSGRFFMARATRRPRPPTTRQGPSRRSTWPVASAATSDRRRPQPQERGERFAQPDAWRRSGARRPSSVAATAGVRLGDGALS
jgi:hypothetical protein